MKATLRLLQHSARLMLFTRANCSLCDTAKAAVKNVMKNKIVDYSEVDVMTEGQEKWKEAYEFDTPVVPYKNFIPSCIDNTGLRMV